MVDDSPLPLAKRRLDTAVHALADPIPVWDNGVARWSDSLYTRLRVALSGGRTTRRMLTHRSRLPCRTEVLDLLVEIDATVGSGEPHGKTTLDRLHQLSGRGWRPQDCERIDDYCAQIERWVLAASDLLDRRPGL